MARVSGGDLIFAHLEKIRAKVEAATLVRVGFLDGADYDGGQSVAQIAAINNFGAPAAGIPARPFFTNMVADKSKGWGATFGAVLKNAAYDSQKALTIMGADIADQLRQAIVDMDSPANSPVTDLLKQRFPTRAGMTFGDVLQARKDIANGATPPAGKPLVWSGQMLGSVDSEVV